jgi:type II secretion system protein D
MASKHTRFKATSLGVAIPIAGFITVSGLIWAGGFSVVLAQSEDGSTTGPTAAASPGAKSAKPGATPDGRVRLAMRGASWNKVLKRVARHGGMEVVMKSTPPGTFTCTDSDEHTIPDALRLVNRQLEPLGFRAIQQGKFLVLLNLDGLRSGYNSPSFVRFPKANSPATAGQSPPTLQPETLPPGAPPLPTWEQSAGGIMQASGTATAAGSATPAVMELNSDGTAGSGAPSHAPNQAAATNSADAVHLAGEADPAANDAEKKTPEDPQDAKIAKADSTPQIRLFYVSAKWPVVLKSFAEQSGLTLVMKKCPSGTVHFRDWNKHTTGEILAILNQELEEDQSNFRLVRQENFLLVINKDDLRSEYERPVAGNRRRPVHSEVEMITDVRPPAPTVVAPPAQPYASGVVPADASVVSDEAAERPRARTIEPVRLESADDAPELLPAPSDQAAASVPSLRAPRADENITSHTAAFADEPAKNGTAAGSVYLPQHRRVEAVARQLYAALKGRSELIDAGPERLPSFRVFDAPGVRARVTCTIGIDTEHNRLVIDAPARRRSALVHVFGTLDELPPEDDGLTLVSADVPRAALAKNLTSQLNQLIAQNRPAPVPGLDVAPGRATMQATPNQPNLSELIKGLKGEVTVESVPELGILILRGNPTDVDAVMKVIREVERLSAGAAPQVSIMPLQYVNSDSFTKLMNQVYQDLHGLRTSETTPKQQIKFYAIVKPNAVLVIAPPSEMAGVRELTGQLDKPVIPETEFQVFPLRQGVAAQVAKSINDFYKGRTGLGTVVEAVSDARTNSVIVQARPRDLEEVAKLIAKLDGPTASQATLKVFTLNNGDAATIVRLLESLFVTSSQRTGGATQVQTAGGDGSQPPTTLRLSADVRTNSILAVGSPDTLRAVEAVILRLDNTDAHQRQTVVIKLKNNSSDAVQRAISDFVSSERAVAQIDPDLVSTVELLEREVFIVSEPVSNSLLLSATPRYFEELKKMIDKLDAPPTQVVIQAMLVEVTLTNDDEFGIELGFQSPVLFDRSTLSPPVTLQTTTTQNTNTTVANNVALSTTAAPGFQFGDPALGTDGLGTNSIVNKGTVGTQELTNLGVTRLSTVNPSYGSGLVLAASSESISFLLRALSYKDTMHVLSRPMIRTVDNQLAEIQVGKNVPIVTGFIPTPNGSLAPIVRYDGAGIILQVKPRITPDGMIVMAAQIEKSNYEQGGVVLVTDPVTGRTITSPVKDVTRAEATVSLASGETVVMGGLITSSDETIERKVPWVADVPILGQLFRYDTKTTVRTELLVFLTPRVIRSDADDEVLKQIETERLHFMLDEAESIHGPILSTQPPADGLMQQVPPLTMPRSQGSSAVPPGPDGAPLIVPPGGLRGPQQSTPPELPSVMPSPAPGVAPAPGVTPPGATPGTGTAPVKPGVAPPPIPRETWRDDPTVPTTQMPPDTLHDWTALRPTALNGQAFSQRAPAVEQPGTARFPFQPTGGDSASAQTASQEK